MALPDDSDVFEYLHSHRLSLVEAWQQARPLPAHLISRECLLAFFDLLAARPPATPGSDSLAAAARAHFSVADLMHLRSCFIATSLPQANLQTAAQVAYVHSLLDALLVDASQVEARTRAGESLPDDLPIALAILNQEGGVEVTNRRFLELFGYERDDDLSQQARQALLHPDASHAATSGFAQLGRRERSTFAYEQRCLRKDGTEIWLWHTLSRFDKATKTEGRQAYLCASLDISHRKQGELALMAADRAKDEFLAILSHELRTPLNAILSCTDVLGIVEPGGKDYEEAVATIQRNVEVEAKIVDDILDVSRIITGKLPLKHSSFQLSEAVADAIAAVSFRLEAKGIDFECQVAPTLPPLVADRHRVQQVVSNLLTNAIKFTPQGGKIALTAYRSEAELVLKVSDTGRGIKPEFMPSVFLRFHQQDAAAASFHQSLGLGLSIVKQIVDAHAGSVAAESAGLGKGATFTVRLPLRPPHHKGDVVTQVIRAATSEREGATRLPLPLHKRILIVDDHRDAVKLNTLLLRRHGFDVTGAFSGREALDIVSADSTFDLLLSDISMPEMDGYNLLKEIRQLEKKCHRPALTAIALSAFASVQDRHRSLQEGFLEHLAKPVKSHELLQVIAKALASSPSN